MEIKHLDKRGWDFLMVEEGFKLRPYLDTGKVPTVGMGMTYYPDTGLRVTMRDKPLTEAQGLLYAQVIIKPYEVAVWSVTRDDLNQNQFNALVSICYNIGVTNFRKSTLLKRVNKNLNDVDGISEAFLMWRYDNGKPVLLPRRGREVTMFFAPV